MTVLDRGCRLLNDCDTPADVKELAQTIADELGEDSAQMSDWEQYVSTRLKELKAR